MTCDARESRHFLENGEMEPPRSGGERYPAGDDFQFLPARSRTAVYIPHGMEIALPPPIQRFENFSTPSIDFFNPHDRSRSTPGAEVNITNNTTVLVVDVPVRPIEKLKRAVKKMQRISRREANLSRFNDGSNGSRSLSVRPTDSRHVSRYDGGRSSLRLDRSRRGLNSETSSLDEKGDMDASQLLRENLDLKHRLEEEEACYRRKIDTYRMAQQHQATLVSRLQAKVLQYKKRCSDLESEIKDSLPLFDSAKPYKAITAPPGSALDAAQQHLRDSHEEPILDFDTALRRLSEEQIRNEKLSKLNFALREQLEESQRTNESLTNDLQKLACDWQQMRDEMTEKEEEWKEEEQFFNEYYNTEHSRMLNLWKDIVAMKRNFGEIQSATQHDLSKLRNEMNSMSNDVVATCSNTLASTAQSMIAGKQQELKKENQELHTKLNKLKTDYDNTVEQVKQKEEKVQQLSKEVQSLNKKVSETDENLQEMTELQDEVKILLNGMNEIAQTVLHDVDSKDLDLIQSFPHVHLSSVAGTPSRAQAENVFRMHTAAAFAESTISGVQAALFKYQSQIHELQVKLSSLTEQLIMADKQNETNVDSQRKLTDRVGEQNDELDSLKAEMNLLSQEKETLIKALESTRSEKAAIDKNRLEMSNMLEAVNTDYEKMLKSNNRLQKIALNLEDEKNFLQNEVDRLSKELETRELTCRMTEDRCSQMLEECLTIKEELNKERLDKELLEQNRSEAQSLLAYIEKSKGELESELQKVLMERSEVHDALAKAESQVSSLEEERKKLLDDLKNTDETKTKFQSQLTDLNNDLGAVRKELLHTEQNRLDLETEKLALLEKCKFLETEKDKLEAELSHVTQERNDFNDQLLNCQRKKDVLTEELMRLRHRIEQVGETNVRVNKHLEDLVKECEEKQVVLESNEKEIAHLRELNLILKNDKESLEGMLFETQNNLEASEMKREVMEKDIQELLTKQESLKGEVTKLEKELNDVEKQFSDTKANLIQQLKSQEAEFKQKIENCKSQNEENSHRLEQEKEQLRGNLEKKMQSALSDLNQEKLEEVTVLQKKIENFKQQLETQGQQYEEALRRAESDKQQALLLAHQDQKAMLEKLEAIRVELDDERIASEKLRRESNLKVEQDRTNINTLRDQVTRLTSKIEDMRIKTEEERQKYENEIDDMKKERDANVKECEELKVELSLCEDRFESIKGQLSETNHKLKEAEKNADYLKRELNDGKRLLNECNIEKEKYLLSNKELRDFIKKSEAEKREQARSLEEAYQKITGLEDKINQLENEKSRLQNVCREIEFKLMQSSQNSQSLHQELEKLTATNLQAQNDEKELLSKFNIELEDKEKLQQELHLYKKQLFEAERNIDSNQQELMKIRQRIREDEDQWRLREQELLARLEDSRGNERKLEDDKHNLELCLADANQQIQDLKARLGGSEGRVRALDNHLSQLEATKKELENRLKAIGNIFRRLNVIQQEGLLSTSLRVMGPLRRWSPSRAAPESVFESGRTDNALDVDPDCIKKTVQLLLQQMAQLERERDDLKIQAVNVKKQLDETYEVQNKNEAKISSMVQCIRQLNEEKGALEVQLDQKETNLSHESEILKQKIDENQHLRDRISLLELNVQSGSEEKQQLEERFTKLRNVNSQLEIERQKLKDDLTRVESRSARLEIQRIALEGDLNRLQMILQEKDSQVQKMQDRLETQTRAIASLEEKCDSLQSTVDQLNSSLEISNSVEADLRAEVQSLQKSLTECSFTSHSSNDRIKQLQKTLSNNENERRLLIERLERTERALTELHAECKARGDQVNSLQSELDAKEIQRAHLEDQLRFAKFSSSMLDEKDSMLTFHKLQIDCCELRGKVEMLEEKIRRLENEKKMLERRLNLERGKSHEKVESVDLLQSNLGFGASSSFNVSYLEHENKDLKQKCNQLEALLAEKEAELAHLKARDFSRTSMERSDDLERYRAGQLRAEHLLKAREQSHKQQVQHLKNEINNLRKRLDQEMKLKRRYLLETPTENLRMRQLRDTLADSLRTVSQNPTLDALLLDHETKKLNSSLHLVKSDPMRSLVAVTRK